MNHTTFLLDMIIAAQTAGIRLLTMQQQDGVQKVKMYRHDFVSNGDHESDRIIQEVLGRKYPHIPFYTEESGGVAAVEGLLWVVDAVDGTLNFFGRDTQYWSVSIALVKDGQTVCAVIFQPTTGKAFCAIEGKPASLYGGGLLKVNTQTELLESNVWTDWTKGDDEVVFAILRKLKEHTLLPQIRNNATGQAMDVATGRIEGYVHPEPTPFDTAAAGLIVKQAGGEVTDIAGERWNFLSSSFVATNGLIHDRLLEVLKQ